MRTVISVRNDGKVNLTTVYSVIIALLPVIMIYNVPIVNKGLSTILIGLTAPIAIYYIFTYFKMCPPTWFVCIFLFYCMYRSWGNFESVFLLFMVLIHVLGAFGGSLDFRVMRKTIETVAVLCTYLVIIQYVLYYALGVRFSFLIQSLILEADRHQVSGFINSSGLLRPSAVFLEPSHYAQYCNLAILSVLFPLDEEKTDIQKAVWIAAGIILTTSGMGIVLCACLFLWFVVFSKRSQGIVVIMRTIGWILFGVVLFLILMRIPFFNAAIGRITGTGSYDAVWGRTLYWDSTVGKMQGKTLLFGNGASSVPKVYMTGLMRVLYMYGIIGTAVLFITFVSFMAKGRNNFTICACIIYLGLMCVANLFSFIALIFWLCILSASVIKNQTME